MSALWIWAAGALGAYFLGSIPFGLLIGLARGVDIRQHGSRNIGATNAGRVLGRRWGVLCFALDVAKGLVPVLTVGWLTGALAASHGGRLAPLDALPWLAIVACAIGGHMFSVFLRFKGGKGVATGFGALLGLWPVLTLAALIALGVWIICIRATRIVSISSIAAASSLPVSTLLLALARSIRPGTTLALTLSLALLAALVIWKHRANIARLRAGTEPRVGAPRATQAR